MEIVGRRVRLVPENRIAEVYRIEERGGQFVVGLILEDTKEAKTFVLTEEEIKQRLELLPSLKESFVQKDLLPRDQCLAFADALRMRLAYTFDPH
ncbi:MAG: hypothetical protein ACUVTP_13530, partial [Candidatus Fervidibacter sp.]